MDITPADYFALSANYITNSVEKLSSPIPESKQNNPYYKVTFNEFKLAALEKDRNFKVYQVPSAVAVQTIYGALKYDVAKLAQPDYDFDSFITDLRSNLGGKRG